MNVRMYVCMYEAEAEVYHQQQLCNRKFLPATLAASSLSCKDIRKITEEHAELCHRKILEERVVQDALMRSGAHHIWSSTFRKAFSNGV